MGKIKYWKEYREKNKEKIMKQKRKDIVHQKVGLCAK